MSHSSTKDEIKPEFARRLQSRYIAKGWNQSELARNAGQFLPKGKRFGRDSISHYVRAKVLPRGDHLDALAKALGCTTEDLMPVHGRPSVSKTQAAFDFKRGEGNTTLVTINMVMPNDEAMQVYQIVTRVKVENEG